MHACFEDYVTKDKILERCTKAENHIFLRCTKQRELTKKVDSGVCEVYLVYIFKIS